MEAGKRDMNLFPVYPGVHWHGTFVMDCGFAFSSGLHCDSITKGKID